MLYEDNCQLELPAQWLKREQSLLPTRDIPTAWCIIHTYCKHNDIDTGEVAFAN